MVVLHYLVKFSKISIIQLICTGSIKLIIFDLNTDKIIQKYYFSEEEAPVATSFLVSQSPPNLPSLLFFTE